VYDGSEPKYCKVFFKVVRSWGDFAPCFRGLVGYWPLVDLSGSESRKEVGPRRAWWRHVAVVVRFAYRDFVPRRNLSSWLPATANGLLRRSVWPPRQHLVRFPVAHGGIGWKPRAAGGIAPRLSRCGDV